MDPKIFVLDLIKNNAFIFDVSPKSTNQQGISSRSYKNPSIKQFSSSKNTLFNKYLIGYQWINIFLFWIDYVRSTWKKDPHRFSACRKTTYLFKALYLTKEYVYNIQPSAIKQTNLHLRDPPCFDCSRAWNCKGGPQWRWDHFGRNS